MEIVLANIKPLLILKFVPKAVSEFLSGFLTLSVVYGTNFIITAGFRFRSKFYLKCAATSIMKWVFVRIFRISKGFHKTKLKL
jgi:hypothetical protein